MANRILALALLSFGLVPVTGCDALSALQEELIRGGSAEAEDAGGSERAESPTDAAAASAAADEAPSQKPPGWESLEDESSATRIYYQFVDERGSVRFVERLDEVPPQWRATVGFVEMATAPPLTPGDAARARAARTRRTAAVPMRVASAEPSVVLYSATWCGACRKAKRYLDRNGVDYDERDIDDPHHARALVQLTGRRAIPVLDVEGRVVTGFSTSSYDALIDRI